MSRKTRGRARKVPSTHHDRIRMRWRTGIPQKALAVDYGVSQSTISEIVNKKRRRLE